VRNNAHGQALKPIDVTKSGWLCAIEDDGSVRLGLRYVKGLREAIGRQIEAERSARPFDSVADLVRRIGVNREELARLGEVGVCPACGSSAARPLGGAYPAYPPLTPRCDPSRVPPAR
jgi:error-prone DNA polymerase